MPSRDLVGNLDALQTTEPFDVCVIGAGAAGTVIGTRLAERGLRVAMLDSGNRLLDWFLDPRLKKLAEYELTGDTGFPLTRTAARIVGGNTNFWTGRCERFHPSDFEPHAYTPPGNPWPISYAELEPYYVRAETLLRVRGGRLSEHAPPRSRPLPLPARPDISSLKRLMATAGVIVEDSPTATPTRSIRFFRFKDEILPRFLAAPSGVLVSGVTATRLIHDAEARIVGAEVRTLDGETRIARARVFVLACGGIQTPRLLLLSRSERFPNGIGNRYDRVGRGFNEHIGPSIYGKIPHSRFTLDPRHKIGRVHQCYDSFRSEGLGAVLPVIIQSWLFPNHLRHYRLADVPSELTDLLSRLVRPSLYMGAHIEMRSVDENRVTLSRTRTDAFGNPLAHLIFNYTEEDRRLLARLRTLLRSWFEKVGATDLKEHDVTFSRHHMSTCRMGEASTTSVVDRHLRVHETPNLYLGGCEVFVTGGAGSPVVTIVALAERLADHLVTQFRGAHPAFTSATAGTPPITLGG